jgi:hypothetical protein
VTAICDDGVAVADILENRIDTHGRTRWRDAIQDLGIDWPMRARSSTTRRATFWTRRFRSFIRRGAAIRYASACAAALPLSTQRSMPAVRRNLAADLVALCRRAAQQARRDPAPAQRGA